jgi:hypothetical protein
MKMNNKKKIIEYIGIIIVVYLAIKIFSFLIFDMPKTIGEYDKMDDLKIKINYITSHLKNMEKENEIIIKFPDHNNIVVDQNGNIIGTEIKQPKSGYIKITPDNRRMVFYKSDKIKGPIALASDEVGNIYVSNYSANNVLKITPQGVCSVLVEKLDKPYGLHVDGNMLFITCQGSNSIYRQKIGR